MKATLDPIARRTVSPYSADKRRHRSAEVTLERFELQRLFRLKWSANDPFGKGQPRLRSVTRMRSHDEIVIRSEHFFDQGGGGPSGEEFRLRVNGRSSTSVPAQIGAPLRAAARAMT